MRGQSRLNIALSLLPRTASTLQSGLPWKDCSTKMPNTRGCMPSTVAKETNVESCERCSVSSSIGREEGIESKGNVVEGQNLEFHLRGEDIAYILRLFLEFFELLFLKEGLEPRFDDRAHCPEFEVLEALEKGFVCRKRLAERLEYTLSAAQRGIERYFELGRRSNSRRKGFQNGKPSTRIPVWRSYIPFGGAGSIDTVARFEIDEHFI